MVALGITTSLSGFFGEESPAWMGVSVFLSLSICLLLRSLQRNPNLGRYFARRITRIWPIYFGTIGTIFLLWDHSWAHLLLNAVFLGSFVPNGLLISGGLVGAGNVLWTLQLEEWAYLSFPWVAARSARTQERVAWAAIGISIAFVALLYWGSGVVWHGAPPFWVVSAYTMPFLWAASYGWGILAFLKRLPTWWALWPLPIAPFLVTLGTGWGFPTAAWILLFGPFGGALVQAPPRWLAQGWAVFLGSISYALYATHAVFFRALGAIAGGAVAPLGAWVIERIVKQPRV
jgi:peptidoglycan/LPS O-acetylase OafA/YrhL